MLSCMNPLPKSLSEGLSWRILLIITKSPITDMLFLSMMLRFPFQFILLFAICWQGLQTGDISLVIGTHSLIAEKVEFSALRIAVVDEQHRFGVIQRGRFNSKVMCLDLPRLVMNVLLKVSEDFPLCNQDKTKLGIITDRSLVLHLTVLVVNVRLLVFSFCV